MSAPVETKPEIASRLYHQFPSLSWKAISNTLQKARDKRKSLSSNQGQPPDVAEKSQPDQTPVKARKIEEGASDKANSRGTHRGRRILFHKRTTTSVHARFTSSIAETLAGYKSRPKAAHGSGLSGASSVAPAKKKPEDVLDRSDSDGTWSAPPQIWASQFPGGEATRVHTPPLKQGTADGKTRGLFFDVNGPTSDQGDKSGSTTSTRGTRNTESTHQGSSKSSKRKGMTREW